MTLKELLDNMYSPLDRTPTTIQIYEGDKEDFFVGDSDFTEYGFSPDQLIISFERKGMLPTEYIFSDMILDKEVEGIYPEDGVIKIAIESLNFIRLGKEENDEGDYEEE